MIRTGKEQKEQAKERKMTMREWPGTGDRLMQKQKGESERRLPHCTVPR